MSQSRPSELARRRLDGRLSDRSVVTRLSTPPRGWIRAIRQALGMTTGQLARRLGLGQSTVVALEQSEAHGNIKLSSLKHAAEALNCTLVYALIPNDSLEDIVRKRKIELARTTLDSVARSMLLEDQTVNDQDAKDRNLEMAIDAIDERNLWQDL
jgi:predicted DNA-binding mobile mystery protein A